MNTPLNRRMGRTPPLVRRTTAQIVQPPAATRMPARLRMWLESPRGGFVPMVLMSLMILIMVVPQGLDYEGTDMMPTQGDTLSRTIWLILMAGGFYLLASNAAKTVAFLKQMNPFLLAFAVLALASLVWSIEPAVTLRRVNRVYTILACCIGCSLVAWHARRFQNLLRGLLTVILIASVIFVYSNPLLSIHHEEGHPELMNAWHGITTGKNIFGSLASAALLMWLHAALSKQVNLFYSLLGLALSGTCLVMSRSSTSLMATAFAAIFMLVLLRSPGSMKFYLKYFVIFFATVILIYALAVLHLVPGLDAILTPITAITGKDLTFTGRVNIWYVLNLHIAQAPFLGTGYGAYWIGPIASSPSYQMVYLLMFYPTEGHNGYLDVINDLGMVGGFVMLGYFWMYVRDCLRLLKIDRYQAALYLTLIFRGFIADMSESHWFSVLSVDFVIMTFATTALTRSLLQSRAERAKAREGH